MPPSPTNGSHTVAMREKLSAFVITHNRAALLETCLRAVSFADELIVIDKSSTDGSAAVAARHASRVEIVPWSPTVEETRAFALSLCRHGRILCLDDDEIVSPETGPYIRDDRIWETADIHGIPLRHYILGVHDERAYYWPETHHRLFRKGAVEFLPTVHGGVALQSDRIAAIPVESGVCIHHLSHPDVASWIERTNRYTSRPNRARVSGGEDDLVRFSHGRIDHWMQRTRPSAPDDNPAAVAVLRAIYDMVDRLKTWETARGLDGEALFRAVAEKLVPAAVENTAQGAIRIAEADTGDPTTSPAGPSTRSSVGPPARSPAGPPTGDPAGGRTEALDERALLVGLRATEAELRDSVARTRKSDVALTAAHAELGGARTALARTDAALADARADLARVHATLADTGGALDAARAALATAAADLAVEKAGHARTEGERAAVTAALAATRTALGDAQTDLAGTRATLGETVAARALGQAALDDALAALAATRAILAAARREQEDLSGSARQFLRQYWPKLWRHATRG